MSEADCMTAALVSVLFGVQETDNEHAKKKKLRVCTLLQIL